MDARKGVAALTLATIMLSGCATPGGGAITEQLGIEEPEQTASESADTSGVETKTGVGGVESPPAVRTTKPPQWPKELPVYPGARVLVWRVTTDVGGYPGATLSMMSDAPPGAIGSYYRARLSGAGWKPGDPLVVESGGAENVLVIGRKGKLRATVNAARRAGDANTAVTVNIGST